MSEINTDRTQKTHKKSAIIALVALFIILGGFAGIGSGVLQYTVATIGCLRAPVAASRFMAGYSYILPGEEGYGPGIFNEYYCTEQAAKDAGFRPGVSTETGEAESQARQKEQEEAKRFSPEKVNFTVYVPTGATYSAGKKEINSMGSHNDNKQVFFSVKKDGYRIVNVREGKVPNSYELCTGAEDSCAVVGTDASGRPIKKQVANTDIVAYGITIGDTFINLEDGSPDLTMQDVINIFNSLTEYKGE